MQRLSPAIERVLERGIPYQLELQLRRPDGKLAWINTRGEAVRDPSGRITGIRGVAQEITELKELQRLREEWISVIAHDLRQPIGVISISAGLLPALHEGQLREKEQQVIERIHVAGSTLARMVNDLLDASRMETNRLILERTWVDPRQLTREVVARMSHVTGGFEVRVSEEGELQPLFVDPTRLGQILSNLLSNAGKYGEKGTGIRVNLRQGDDSIEFSVTNRGRGIRHEEIPHLFDRFTRTRASLNGGIPGLGLGLYITRGLVEAHGGRIWVESVPCETTTFRFVLPIRADLKERAA
jgi:signal transduction histidine kinase